MARNLLLHLLTSADHRTRGENQLNDAYVIARRILTLAALLLSALPVAARPLLVGYKQYLDIPPPVPEDFPGQWRGATTYRSPAIDGDTLLVSANRPTDTDGGRVDGVYLFQRGADGTWRYVKALEEGQPGSGLVNGNLATVQVLSNLMVFERGAQGWAQTATIVLDGARGAIRIDDGSIFVEPRRIFGQSGCIDPYEQWRKVNGTWQVVATIGPPRCDDSSRLVDINEGRALVLHQPPTGPVPPSDVYAQNGTSAWSRVAGLKSPYYSYYGSVAAARAFVAPSFLYRDTGGNSWSGPNRLVEPESELDLASSFPKLRGNSLVLHGDEADYEILSRDEDFPTWWATLRIYRPRADGYFDYFARLSADFDITDFAVSDDGTRIAALSASDNGRVSDSTLLYVFELPATATFPGTQQDTFESGTTAKWTATVGQFSVASTPYSRVMRQSSITGDAKAYITAIDWTDQAIEADIRPTEFGGTDRWFGLATRRTDDQNYYYATYRYPRTISLRRMRNGVVTELARDSLREPLVAGRSYRVRLESVGDQHAVFINGFPAAHAKDRTFTHGHPGVVSYRTRFDADNVIVSSGTRVLLRFDTYQREWASAALAQGQWNLVSEPSDDVNEYGESISFVMRQSDISGDAKWFSKIAAGNQVISTRVRPNSFGTTTGTNDAWVGIAAHVIDERNYYYVTLRRRGEFSLRRMVDGQVQVIMTVSQNVVAGSWYDLRLEIIGTDIRAYVNGDLKISVKDPAMTGGGRNAILMYKTAADFYHYIAYQP
jgi:hypothetical protein